MLCVTSVVDGRSVFVGKVPHEHAQPEDKFSSNAKSWLSEFGSIEQVKCNFIQRETIPLPSGETIYRLDRESFCLVTFATAAEKTAALGKAPDKPELEGAFWGLVFFLVSFWCGDIWTHVCWSSGRDAS